MKAILLYNSLKTKLNDEIDSLKKDQRVTEINTNKTVYLTILMESLATTYTKVSNDLCINNEIDFSSNTFCDRRQKLNNNMFSNLNNILLKFIKKELRIKSKIYAVDGSKISLSLEMNKEGFQILLEHNLKENKK